MKRILLVTSILICNLTVTAGIAAADYVFTWKHNIPNTNPLATPPPLSCNSLKIEIKAGNGSVLQNPYISNVFNKIGDTAKLDATSNGCASVSAYTYCYYGTSQGRAEAHGLPCTSGTININSLNSISKQ